MSKWHPRRRIWTNGLATSIKRSCLDRTDYIQAKKGETTSFLALKWLKKTLKSPIVWELFPRARLIANMNIDFKNYLLFRWVFRNFGRRTENRRKTSRTSLSLSIEYKMQLDNKLLADCRLDQSGYYWTSLVVKRNSWKETNKKGQTSVEG